MKNCIKCNIPLNKENTTWYRLKNYIYKCNYCVRKEKAEQGRKRWERDPKGCAARSRKASYKLKNNSPKKYTARQQCCSAKKRARALGLDFDLTEDFIISISPNYCPILGVTLKYGGGEKTNASPALDRINSHGGYVEGNVQIISVLANLMKSNATKEELITFAKWVLLVYQ